MRRLLKADTPSSHFSDQSHSQKKIRWSVAAGNGGGECSGQKRPRASQCRVSQEYNLIKSVIHSAQVRIMS
jgi:hypothetical protein